MDDPFDPDEHGSDKFDDSCLVVGAIYILGADWLREAVTWEFVLFDESPIKAIN